LLFGFEKFNYIGTMHGLSISFCSVFDGGLPSDLFRKTGSSKVL